MSFWNGFEKRAISLGFVNKFIQRAEAKATDAAIKTVKNRQSSRELGKALKPFADYRNRLFRNSEAVNKHYHGEVTMKNRVGRRGVLHDFVKGTVKDLRTLVKK